MRTFSLWAGIVAIVVMTLGTRLWHPDMTETRLFLAFWPRWIVCVVLAVGVMFLLRSAEPRP
jgi:hypothetical protein